MAKRKVVEPAFEQNDGVLHPEHQVVNTRISYYMKMYASGKIDELPTTNMVPDRELPDGVRNELLNGVLPIPEMGTDPVEVMEYLNENREKFINLVNEYNLCVTDREKYDRAISVLNDKNASIDEKIEASAVLQKIEQNARARKS